MIQFWFEEREAAQAAAWMLRCYGKPMEAEKLLSLLYLVDREAFVDKGYPLTGDTFIATKDGPSLQHLECLVRSRPCPDGEYGDEWRRYVRRVDEHRVSVTEADDWGATSEYARAILARVVERHRAASCADLIALKRSLPEWRPPHQAEELIDPAIILRDAGFTDEEIQEDTDNAAAVMWLRTTLRS